MRCKDCALYWREEDESYPSCKVERTTWNIPPCEYEKHEEYDYEEEE